MPKHRRRELRTRLWAGASAVAAFALLLSTGCFEPTNETSSSTSTETMTTSIPSLAEIQSKVGLTDDQSAALGPAHERWRQAEQTQRQTGLTAEAPAMEFIASSASVLNHDQLLQLIGVLHDTQAARIGGVGNGPPPGAGPGGPAGPAGPGRMGGRHRGPGMPGPGVDPFADLGLTEEQRTQVDQAMAELHSTMRSLHEQFRNGELTQEQLDAAVRAAHDQFVTALQQILTEEQWAQLQEIQRQRIVERLTTQLATYDDHAARIVSLLDRILDLSDQQIADIQDVLQQSKSKLEEVLAGLQSGDLSPDDARAALEQIHEDTRTGIRATLTEEQAQIFDALHTLRPHHRGPLP